MVLTDASTLLRREKYNNFGSKRADFVVINEEVKICQLEHVSVSTEKWLKMKYIIRHCYGIVN